LTRSKVATSPGDVSIIVDGPASPKQLLVLGHGAGASMDSDFMEYFATALVTKQRAVARFNFVYMELGRRSPGPAKVSEATFMEVVEHLRSMLGLAKSSSAESPTAVGWRLISPLQVCR
jgi:predicted alpha/beta-hydrolase family hydrolase